MLHCFCSRPFRSGSEADSAPLMMTCGPRSDVLPTTQRQLRRFSLALPPPTELRVFSGSLDIGWATLAT